MIDAVTASEKEMNMQRLLARTPLFVWLAISAIGFALSALLKTISRMPVWL